MRKDSKAMKKLLAEIDAQILACEKAKAGSLGLWTPSEDATVTLLRCFKFVFEHNF